VATTLIYQDNLSVATSFTNVPGVAVDFMESGYPRQRILSQDEWQDVVLKFENLTDAEAESLRAFVANYKTSEIDFTIQGRTYSGWITGSMTRTSGDYDVISANLPMRVK
jgi:hypothetical protein